MTVYREQERVQRCDFRKYFYEEDLSPLQKVKKNRNSKGKRKIEHKKKKNVWTEKREVRKISKESKKKNNK